MAFRISLAGAAMLLLLLGDTASAMPPDYMIPPGATKLRDANGVTDFDIAMEPDDIVKYYWGKLPALGYSLTDPVATPASVSFYFNLGDGKNGSVLIRQGINGMHVTVTFRE